MVRSESVAIYNADKAESVLMESYVRLQGFCKEVLNSALKTSAAPFKPFVSVRVQSQQETIYWFDFT